MGLFQVANDMFPIDKLNHILFQCNDNQVEDWADLDELSKIPSLETVYLERNPLQSNDLSGYRRKILLALPTLKQLDATLTGK